VIATTSDRKEIMMATASMPKTPTVGACAPPGVTDKRVLASFNIRFDTATEEALVPIPPHTTNGDEERYADKCATYTKCQSRPN
jgi:hypothetical protein